jgi:hypothetical protein
MPLNIGSEEPTPLHCACFGFEEDGVFNVLEGRDEKLVFRFLWQCRAYT